VVAKYAARIGQCFSSSKIGVTHVPLEQMSHIPDVVRNGYTFSDGVGRISHPLAVKIQDALKLKTLPSAFQVSSSRPHALHVSVLCA
jgi:RNA-dependent RNA polymerase